MKKRNSTPTARPHPGVWLLLLVLVGNLLAACSDTPSGPPPTYGFPTVTPTLEPAFPAVPNITPSPTVYEVPPTAAPPTATPYPMPPTPIVAPTPLVPKELTLSGNDLGISGWTDTEVKWSPASDQFLLHIINQNDQNDFFFLVRPPASAIAGLRLPRTNAGTLTWSPDGRYLAWVQLDVDGNAGPVRAVDTVETPNRVVELFRGPCTAANWLNSGELLASCGSVVFSLNPAVKGIPDAPKTVFKLDEQNRFPGSPTQLSLIARTLPSPDGKRLALFGLARDAKTPSGEIGFYNLETQKFDVLDRNNRAVAPVDWTPDSKFLILRNLSGDWAVSYTFDFYLADLAKLKITQNLTRSNPKCDPVLGKPDCQGSQASTYQTSSVSFAPNGNDYLVTGLRYAPRFSVGLQTAERLISGTLSTGKQSQGVEQPLGGRILGLTWLKSGYFYSFVPDSGPAKAFLNGKPLEIKSAATTTSTVKPGSSPVPPTTVGRNIISSDYALQFSAVETTTTAPITTSPPAPATTPPTTTNPPETTAPAPTTLAGDPTPTAEPIVGPTKPPPTAPITPTATPANPYSIGPSVSVTATAVVTITPATVGPYPTAPPLVTPTPKIDVTRPIPSGYYIAPKSNWILSVERVANTNSAVQFQVRLIPYQ